MMHGLGNMHNGGNGMPAGVSMPRRRPAMWFDGTNDYIGIGNMPLSQEFTWLLWLFTVKSYWNAIISINNTSFGLYKNNLNQLGMWQGPFFYSGVTLDLYTPYKIAVTRDMSDKVRVYVNGEQTPNTVTLLPYVGSVVMKLGNDCQVSTYLNGNIQHIVVLDKCLSPEQIGLYNPLQDKVDVTGAVGYWKGNGITTEAWQDLSGNGHHGTVYGSPERCLVHQRGIVIRTNPATGKRYRVN